MVLLKFQKFPKIKRCNFRKFLSLKQHHIPFHIYFRPPTCATASRRSHQRSPRRRRFRCTSGTLTETRLRSFRGRISVEVGWLQFGPRARLLLLLRLRRIRWEGRLGRDTASGWVTAHSRRYETVDVIGAVRFRGG